MFKETCRVIWELRERVPEKKEKEKDRAEPEACLEMNYEVGSYGEG